MKTRKIRAFLERYAQNYCGVPAGLDAASALEALADVELELESLRMEPSAATASLRDTFAAAALTGLTTHRDSFRLDPKSTETIARISRASYALADAMLAAREGKP